MSPPIIIIFEHMLSICYNLDKIIVKILISAKFIGVQRIRVAYAKTSGGVEPDPLSICKLSTPVEL